MIESFPLLYARFAYVDLPSEDQVERCVALSESQLGGRNLLIKSGTDFRGRPGLDPTAAELGSISSIDRQGHTGPVSYTHLTLPTICSV